MTVRTAHPRRKRSLVTNNLAGYLFIGPWLFGFIAFTIIPVLMSLYYSFTSYDLIGQPNWIGLQNYITIFTNDVRFMKAVDVTVRYVVTYVPLRLMFALFVAMLFRVQRRGVSVYRAVYYVPSVVGGSVAVAVMWKQLFGRSGVINSLLISIGIMAPSAARAWAQTPSTALMTLIVLAVWQFGSPMLIFLAGLKQIPQQLYEAASIDGAGPIAQFFRITLPSLSSVIFFNFLMQTISGFLSFTQALLITNGGPMDRTLFYVLYIYLKGFSFNEMGYASALAWIMLLFMALLTGIIFKTSNYWVFYESKGANK